VYKGQGGGAVDWLCGLRQTEGVFASSDHAEGPLLTADFLLELWGPQ